MLFITRIIYVALLLTIPIPGASLAQSSLNSEAMTYWENTWYELVNYNRFQTNSAGSCQRACFESSSCKTYTFNVSNNNCNTSNMYPVRTDANRSGWVSGFKQDRDFDAVYSNVGDKKLVDSRSSTWYEFDTYQRISRPSAESCRLACEVAGNCNAFTFNTENNNCNLTPGNILRSATGGRYKNFVSGFVIAKVDAQKGIDFYGNDYKSIEVANDPAICQQYCLFDKNCKAYTFVLPGTIGGPRPLCYLKSKGLTWENGGRKNNLNTISGVKLIERR
jgi:hypothetical protein